MFLAPQISVGTKNILLLPHLYLTGHNSFVVVMKVMVND